MRIASLRIVSLHTQSHGHNMYRYDEDVPHRKKLTLPLIWKHLSHEIRGACLVLAIPTAVCIIPLAILCMWGMANISAVFEKVSALLAAALLIGLPAWMFAYSLIHLRKIRRHPLSVAKDTVETIAPHTAHAHMKWWKPGRRYHVPLDLFRFVGGGSYATRSQSLRDGPGDEYYIVYFSDRPETILAIYRTTEYEWHPDTE